MRNVSLYFLGLAFSLATVSGCTQPDGASTASPKGCLPASSADGIVGGARVSNAEPLAKKVVILVITKSEGSSICTGAPIASDLILTAAHCVENVDKAVAVFNNDISCESGINVTRDGVPVVTTVVHEGYTGKAATDDLAVVKIQKNIPADYPINKIYQENSVLSSDSVTLIGYGSTGKKGSGGGSGFLRTVNKSYSHDVVTNSYLSGRDRMWISQKEQGMCYGDSGGPVFFEVGGELQIAGVNSAVRGDTDDTMCMGEAYAMYMPAYKEWLKAAMEKLR
ncbi:hypothetical protein AZI86_02520 [Bdellovibrio bacteriovorus]|uniref:Peptidase S1 domain-containing protein n=1 Tax=Bdellovibrio bacteriovorus TaxID=959 RepID=A0A150WN98_BDEBC|nr:trypsin-like serine protease [Bdellovibrio bacteriovorus]KYG65961.1 hypothetical protein AZI86_02520 [Bdellovibrio bacteriovorus]